MVSPNRIQGSPLATQGSVYNLSFNDIQDQLGRPLNRMNIDDLLKSVINTNTNTNTNTTGGGGGGGGGGAPPASASASDNHHHNNNNNNNNHHHQLDSVKNVSSPSPSSLSSSSSSSPPAPFTFTHKSLTTPPAAGSTSNEAFAQTTLEDFLLRHGGFDVDVDNPQPLSSATMDPMIPQPQPQPGDWLHFPINQQHRQMDVLPSHLPAPTTTPLLADVPYSDNQPMPMVVPVPVPPCIHPAPERKRRISDEMLKTTIERKQKRMIKNRESAARSRARKQAYTNKLEHQVAQLRKLNNMLSKEKEVAALFPLDPAKPKHQLRRTSSATF